MTAQHAAADDLRELYRQLIIDHARSPRHFGQLAHATHRAEGINPLCGDKLQLYLEVDDHECIKSSSFEGSGCAIAVASASLLTDTITGMSVNEADDVFASITARLTQGAGSEMQQSLADDATHIAKLHALDGVREFPARVKCATLAWHTLHSALHGAATPATTEQ